MNEHKVIYKKCLLLIIIFLAIYGAYSSGVKHKNNAINNSLEVNKEYKIPADKITFNNYDGYSDNTESENSNSRITYDNFTKLKMGSSYEDIEDILGKGREVYSNEISKVKTTIYEYEGEGVSDITLTLQNNKLTSKTQMGLKTMNAGITLDKYDIILDGMSYDEVSLLLGDGQLTTESNISGNSTYVYSYINEDGSSANFTFGSKGLIMKAQYNLK